MTEVKYLQLGSDEAGCLHCEIASLLRLLLAGRYHAGEVTTASELRAAMAQLLKEIEIQILELSPDDGGKAN